MRLLFEKEAVKRATDSVTRSSDFIAKKVAGLKRKSIPEVAVLAKMTKNDLQKFKVDKINWCEAGTNDVLDVGLSFSNGQSDQGGTYDCDKSFTLPSDLGKIETVFTNNQCWIYEIRLYNSSGTIIKTLGRPNSKFGPGRVETFTIANNERLLGFEAHHNGLSVFGLTWLKWSPP